MKEELTEEQKIKKREYMKNYYREYYKKNRAKVIGYVEKYNKKNSKKIKAYRKNYYQSDSFKELDKKRYFLKRSNPEWIVKERLRVYHLKVLKKAENLNARKIIDIKKIVEKLKPFPTNLEDFEIDHRLPLCSFNLKKESEIKKAFHQSNYQWLLRRENKIKGVKILDGDLVRMSKIFETEGI